MNIVHVFAFPLRTGGHFKSGLGLVRQLADQGHRNIVLAPGGVEEMRALYEATGAKLCIIPELDAKREIPRIALARQILRAIDGEGVDVFHSHDYRSAVHTYLAAAMAHRAFVLSLPGGPFNFSRPPERGETIVFSQELLSRIQSEYGTPGSHLHLIRARIDTELYRPTEASPDLWARYPLPTVGKKIFMAIRIEESKKAWIDTLLTLVDELRHLEDDVHVIIAGEGPLLPFVREQAERLRSRRTEAKLLHPIGPVFDPEELCQLYSYADLVIGNGRGILEAMACKKPVFILGEMGEGEIVDIDNLEDTAYYNFSGRHFRTRASAPPPPIETIGSLITDEDALREKGETSYGYIRAHMDSRIGADQTVGVYEKAIEHPARLSEYGIWKIKASLAKLRNKARLFRASLRGPTT